MQCKYDPQAAANKSYTVLKRLGAGGFSKVYEAKTSGGKAVALKKSHITRHVIHPMLRHEACALSILAGHPSIPSVYAWGRSQYFEYLAMDLLGPPLVAFAKDDERLELTNVLSLLDQMLSALEHLHSRHIIHRDIKPGNFLFGIGERGERVQLIDYGFSCYYRDPLSLAHHPLEQKQKFVGTIHYASLNAHCGLSLSRRDDLESLAYTVLSLLKVLPWEICQNGTVKHRENRIREKKRTWTGARLCEGLPKEFGCFVDYVRGLGYEQEPDYEHWKHKFRSLFDQLQYSDGSLDLASAGANSLSGRNPEQTPLPNQRGHDASPYITENEPPCAKGQYVLVQLLPHLTIEGRSDVSLDKSRWHDPSLVTGQWKFPKRPALVVDVKPAVSPHGGFIVSLLPLVRKPGELTTEETKRFVRLARETGSEHERVSVFSEEWTMDSIYHDPPPHAFHVQTEFHQAPVQAHWKLNDSQFKQLETLLAAPLPQGLSPEIISILADLKAMEKQHSFTPFAKILPFTPAQVSPFGVNLDAGADDTSWKGSRGFVDELVLISRRRSADNGWAWSYEEGEEEGDSSDDDFLPTTSWPAPEGVSERELLGDEEEILRDSVTIMTAPPVGSTKDLYNGDEKMVV